MIILVMGVSGCGKTTIGSLLGAISNHPHRDMAGQRRLFIDADDFHPIENKEKMKRGIPLQDSDRLEWLARLSMELQRQAAIYPIVVVACSALKKSYREILFRDTKDREHKIVFLKGDKDTIRKRLEKRSGHFMNPTLLDSQFAILEEPDDCIQINIDDRTPSDIVAYLEQELFKSIGSSSSSSKL